MKFIGLIFAAPLLIALPAGAANPAGTPNDPISVVIMSGGSPVGPNNPFPFYAPRPANVSAMPPKVGLVPTSVTLTANICRTLIAANTSRNSLRWQVTGTNPVSISPGGCPLVAPMAYSPPYAAGQQGGSDTFVGELSTGQFSAISASGSVVSVWEGQ